MDVIKLIRKLILKDALPMLQCMKDENVNHFMNIDGKNMKLEDCEKFIHGSFNDKNQHFAIVDEADNWCGTISLKNIDYKVNQAEYAIITSSSVHGKGYALVASKELLDYAFYELKLNRVYLDVLKENVRANRFYEKVGFKYEGCFRESILIKNQIYDLNWYSMLKSDYDLPLEATK